MSDTPNSSAPTAADDVVFNTDIDIDAELQELQQQVGSLKEDHQLQSLQETVAKDEGTRKVAAAAAAGAVPGAPKPGVSVFVGGLDPRTTEADLRLLFAASGAIVRVTILKDRYTSQPKGTAYIEFENADQAQAALLKDGQSLHGKPLKVAPKRDNVPAFQRGGAAAVGRGGFFPRGRGGAQMQQQMAAMAVMAMMGGGGGFNPFGGAPRGRGRGRGGGRGAH